MNLMIFFRIKKIKMEIKENEHLSLIISIKIYIIKSIKQI